MLHIQQGSQRVFVMAGFSLECSWNTAKQGVMLRACPVHWPPKLPSGRGMPSQGATLLCGTLASSNMSAC
jgi:hypothetical protein